MRHAIFAFAMILCSACAGQAARPNIIFILADGMAYGDLGVYGQDPFQTPHLDSLARGGVRFTNAYSGANMCAPARASLLTGMHFGHCRVRSNGGVRGGQEPLLDEDVTVAEVLKSAGYATGFVGKWGVGLPGTTGKRQPLPPTWRANQRD